MDINEKISMFYNADPYLFALAKKLRANMTKAEKVLWGKLNRKQVLALRFKPQHPIDKYIADFYCHKLKLIIEVDGDVHQKEENQRYDIGRENELNQLGIRVIRFRNEEIENNIENVINEIESICSFLLTADSTPRSPKGEGGTHNH